MNFRLIAVVACCLWLALSCPMRGAEPVTGERKSALMERKLTASQRILASLAREDFPQMEVAAEELLTLAKQQWLTHETPQYRSQLKDFWIILEGIKESATEKNLDGATLGYVQMTISCVRCHKLLRDQLE